MSQVKTVDLTSIDNFIIHYYPKSKKYIVEYFDEDDYEEEIVVEEFSNYKEMYNFIMSINPTLEDVPDESYFLGED